MHQELNTVEYMKQIFVSKAFVKSEISITKRKRIYIKLQESIHLSVDNSNFDSVRVANQNVSTAAKKITDGWKTFLNKWDCHR